MKRIIRLTESDLIKLVKRVISEGKEGSTTQSYNFGTCEINTGEKIKNDGGVIRVNCNDKKREVVYDCNARYNVNPLFVVPKGMSPVEGSPKINKDQGLKGIMKSFC